MVNAFPQTPDGLQPFLRLASELNACCVNVIGGVMPIRPEGGVAVVKQWMAEADRANMQLLFETHRDGLLNDLYFTLQMLELVPEMRPCADLSHFVVDREFRSPIPERDQRYMETVLNRSDGFQGRVSNGEQVQIQVGFPQHQEWVAAFKGWWKYGMREWRRTQRGRRQAGIPLRVGTTPVRHDRRRPTGAVRPLEGGVADPPVGTGNLGGPRSRRGQEG